MSGGSEISPLSSAYTKAANGLSGNYTTRGAGVLMASSLPAPAGGNSNMAGSLSFMGKTTLFSRVALSPTGALGEKKSGFATKNAAPSSYDIDTNASTQANLQQQPMNKTVRSSTTTSTFKDTIQRGVLSGAGILKK